MSHQAAANLWFPTHEVTQEYFYSRLDGMLVHGTVTPPDFTLTVPLYPLG